jgi:hypothetical protein
VGWSGAAAILVTIGAATGVAADALPASLVTIVGRAVGGADGERSAGSSTPRPDPSDANTDAGDPVAGALVTAGVGDGRGAVIGSAAGAADSWNCAGLSGVGLAAVTGFDVVASPATPNGAGWGIGEVCARASFDGGDSGSVDPGDFGAVTALLATTAAGEVAGFASGGATTVDAMAGVATGATAGFVTGGGVDLAMIVGATGAESGRIVAASAPTGALGSAAVPVRAGTGKREILDASPFAAS